MDSNARRSWSGNSNHSIQNHKLKIAEPDKISEDKEKEKQWSAIRKDCQGAME